MEAGHHGNRVKDRLCIQQGLLYPHTKFHQN